MVGHSCDSTCKKLGWNFLFLWNFSVEIMFKTYQEEVMEWQGVHTVLHLFVILFVVGNFVTLGDILYYHPLEMAVGCKIRKLMGILN